MGLVAGNGTVGNSVTWTAFYTVPVPVAYYLRTEFSPRWIGNVVRGVQHQLSALHYSLGIREGPRSRVATFYSKPNPLHLRRGIGCHPTSSSGNCSSLWKHTTSGSPWRTPLSPVPAFQHGTSALHRYRCTSIGGILVLDSGRPNETLRLSVYSAIRWWNQGHSCIYLEGTDIISHMPPKFCESCLHQL